MIDFHRDGFVRAAASEFRLPARCTIAQARALLPSKLEHPMLRTAALLVLAPILLAFETAPDLREFRESSTSRAQPLLLLLLLLCRCCC